MIMGSPSSRRHQSHDHDPRRRFGPGVASPPAPLPWSRESVHLCDGESPV